MREFISFWRGKKEKINHQQISPILSKSHFSPPDLQSINQPAKKINQISQFWTLEIWRNFIFVPPQPWIAFSSSLFSPPPTRFFQNYSYLKWFSNFWTSCFQIRVNFQNFVTKGQATKIRGAKSMSVDPDPSQTVIKHFYFFEILKFLLHFSILFWKNVSRLGWRWRWTWGRKERARRQRCRRTPILVSCRTGKNFDFGMLFHFRFFQASEHRSDKKHLNK